MTDIPSHSVSTPAKWHCTTDNNFQCCLTHCSPPLIEIVELLPPLVRSQYESYLHLADKGFYHGQVAASRKTREMHWEHWESFVKPVGVDPYLQGVPYTNHIFFLTGFGAYVQSGNSGRGHQVTAQTFSTALTAIGKVITLVV